MGIEQLKGVERGKPLGGVVERGVQEVKTSLQRIFTSGPRRSTSALGYGVDEAGRMLTTTGGEILRLGGLTISGIVGMTFSAISRLLGGTVKLTGKALAAIPFIPAPAKR
jgi:hypothetical protein